MFENIGKKIKSLCKVVFYVLSACAVMGGLIAFISPIANGADAGPILLGFLLMFVISALGIFLAWLIVMLLYAFGELVDANQIQVKQNRKIISILAGKELKNGEDEEEEEKRSSIKFFESNSINFVNDKNGTGEIL